MSKSAPSGRLVAGSEPFWKKSRPTLAASIDETGIPDPDDDSVMGTSRIVKTFGKVIAILLGVSIVLWLAVLFVLNLTVLPMPRVEGTTWAVKWAAWPQGKAPENSLVGTYKYANQTGILDRSMLILDSSGVSIEQIIAGPSTKVSSDSAGQIIVNGVTTSHKSTTYNMPETATGENYLTKCVSGPCGEPGSYRAIPVQWLLGEVLGEFKPPFSIGNKPEQTAVSPAALPDNINLGSTVVRPNDSTSLNPLDKTKNKNYDILPNGER